MTTRKWLWAVLVLAIAALAFHGAGQIAVVAAMVVLILANLAYDRWGSKGTKSP
jgi:predicted branched-subunit amino acid permease